MGELIPLILLVIALIPKIKQKQWAKKAEEVFHGSMKAPSDLLPEMRPAAVEPVIAMPEQKPVQRKETETVAVPRQEAFRSGFESRPQNIVLDEGIDPCHDGLYEEAEEISIAAESQTRDTAQQDNEWVRGIVLGEILAKPKYRQFAKK